LRQIGDANVTRCSNVETEAFGRRSEMQKPANADRSSDFATGRSTWIGEKAFGLAPLLRFWIPHAAAGTSAKDQSPIRFNR
jgi:hypothetical protein